MSAIKGEVKFTAPDGPKAGDYRLALDFNALCDLEDSFPGLMQGEVKVDKLKDIRRFFHAGLASHHPELTERDVGSIIHAMGLEAASEKLAEAMQAAFPEAKKTENPQ